MEETQNKLEESIVTPPGSLDEAAKLELIRIESIRECHNFYRDVLGYQPKENSEIPYVIDVIYLNAKRARCASVSAYLPKKDINELKRRTGVENIEDLVGRELIGVSDGATLTGIVVPGYTPNKK